MDCKVWSVKCKVWSVECRARNATRLKCCTCQAKSRWRSPKCWACHKNCNSSSENDAIVLRLPHKTTVDTLSNRLECHKVPAPATQNDMTTCLETFEKERFCSFPHRRGEATGKPEARDETRGSIKTSISCETFSNIDIFHTLSNRLECHKVPRLPRKTT